MIFVFKTSGNTADRLKFTQVFLSYDLEISDFVLFCSIAAHM